MRGWSGGMALLLGLALAGPAPARVLGAVAFEPCDLRGRGGTLRAECARFEVPENHADPAGRRLALRLALVPATADVAEPDPVVMLAGGPGQSALDSFPAAQGAFRRVLRTRHVLLVEQRGTGQSNPLQCAVPDWKQAGALTVAAARAQAQACLARYQGRADLRFYTTSDYVRDLEAVRTALGLARLNLVGGSYGTRVALEYVRRHPAVIRSLVLASAVPPELALGQDHAVNLDAAVAALSRRCAADPACAQRHGDLAATLRTLRQQLRTPRPVALNHPRTHRPMTVPFSDAALVGVVRIFLYAPHSAALLPLLVAEAAHGRPQALLAQAEVLQDSLGDELAQGLSLSVTCAEDIDLLRQRPEDATTLLGSDFVALMRAQCEVWPRGARPADFKQPVRATTPALLLSGEYDPVTPPRYGEQVAATLPGSRHLVLRGQGHTPLAAGCMPRLIGQFIDTLQPRALDAACLESLGDAAFFLDAQGPAP